MEIEDEEPAYIQTIPFDIILTVLEYTTITDVVRFGCTCKQFNDMVKGAQGLWKTKLRDTVNAEVYREMEKVAYGDWYNEARKYHRLKDEIHMCIIEMANFYYRCNSDINLYDVKQFIPNSYADGITYYCSIDILQELMKGGNQAVFRQMTEKPFTLTEMYYSKVALRHFLHPCLAIQWVQKNMKRDLSPEFVLNYFVQWVDPLKMHTEKQVDDAITSMAVTVENFLKKLYSPKSKLSIRELCANGEITEVQVVEIITHVIYKEHRMTPVTVANLDTLDIVKVIDVGRGHDVAIAVIYLALSRRFGVHCELIAFPNHLFLELRGSQGKLNRQVYKVILDSGQLRPKRACPYSRHDGQPNNYRYCPDSLLQYVITVFLIPMGTYKTWYMQNAIFLLDFLSTNQATDSKYKAYLPFLVEKHRTGVLYEQMNIKCVTAKHLNLISMLSYITKVPPQHREEEPVNRRTSKVKYAVGMIVQHRVYDYQSVIRSWQVDGYPITPDPDLLNSPYQEPRQPLYLVVAIDQSDRYVAQEQLVDVPRPNRLYHLEEIIAREFTHFNGFAYEPNSYKAAEYPDDLAVSQHYRIRAANLFGNELDDEYRDM